MLNLDSMSPYERQALEALLAVSHNRQERRRLIPARLRALGKQTADGATAQWDKVPGSDSVEQALSTALRALQRGTTELAMRSVSIDAVVRSYNRDFPEVMTPADIRRLDLRECDVRVPLRRAGYGVGAAVAGAGTSVMVTGAVVSTTVTGGTTAAVAIGAIATDVAGTLATLGRIIALVAAQYGYDVREPEEEVFAAGVLGFAMAGTGSSKVSAMASLSRLTQQMMRQATWTQLRRHQLVAVVERVYLALGLRLTHQKLAQAVPVIGIAINAGMNVELVDKTFRRASEAYRLRFLTEKYDLGPEVYGDSFETAVAAMPDDEQPVPMVDDFLPGDGTDTSSEEGRDDGT